VASPTAPFIECEQTHAGLAVSDLAAALEFYTRKLGFQQAFTWGEPPTFAGVNLGKVQMFLAAGTPMPSRDTTTAACGTSRSANPRRPSPAND